MAASIRPGFVFIEGIAACIGSVGLSDTVMIKLEARINANNRTTSPAYLTRGADRAPEATALCECWRHIDLIVTPECEKPRAHLAEAIRSHAISLSIPERATGYPIVSSNRAETQAASSRGSDQQAADITGPALRSAGAIKRFIVDIAA